MDWNQYNGEYSYNYHQDYNGYNAWDYHVSDFDASYQNSQNFCRNPYDFAHDNQAYENYYDPSPQYEYQCDNSYSPFDSQFSYEPQASKSRLELLVEESAKIYKDIEIQTTESRLKFIFADFIDEVNSSLEQLTDQSKNLQAQLNSIQQSLDCQLMYDDDDDGLRYDENCENLKEVRDEICEFDNEDYKAERVEISAPLSKTVSVEPHIPFSRKLGLYPCSPPLHLPSFVFSPPSIRDNFVNKDSHLDVINVNISFVFPK